MKSDGSKIESTAMANSFSAMTPEQIMNAFQNPLATLEAMGGTIDEKYRESVEASMREMALTLAKEIPAPPQRRSSSPIEIEGVTASAEWWGLVVELDEAATQKVMEGLTIAAAVSSAVTAALKLGTVTAPAALITACISAGLALYRLVLGQISQGHGVYLTILWPQILLLPVSPAGLTPIPTARRKP